LSVMLSASREPVGFWLGTACMIVVL